MIENCEKVSSRVENTVGKGEITHKEQFVLFPQCFQKTSDADTKIQGFVWGSVKERNHHYECLLSANPVGRGKMLVTSVFFFFSAHFLLIQGQFLIHIYLIKKSEIIAFGQELTLYQQKSF